MVPSKSKGPMFIIVSLTTYILLYFRSILFQTVYLVSVYFIYICKAFELDSYIQTHIYFAYRFRPANVFYI